MKALIVVTLMSLLVLNTAFAAGKDRPKPPETKRAVLVIPKKDMELIQANEICKLKGAHKSTETLVKCINAEMNKR